MNMTQSDLISRYELETEFFHDHVRHTRYVGEAKEAMKEEWMMCEDLGCGGFGVVHKQIQKATGHYRAVKKIHKRRLPPTFDYSRQLLVMAKLAEVCVPVPGKSPQLTTSTGLSRCVLS